MSKFGFHISAGTRTGFGTVLANCYNAKSPIKIIHALDQNVWDDIIKYSPSTKLIYRHQINGRDNPENMFSGTEQEIRNRAINWMNQMRVNWNLNRADYYAPLNEPNPDTLAQCKALDIFMDQCIILAESWGLKLALPGFSTGTPSDDSGVTRYQRWAEMLPSLTKMKKGGHLLNLHEYGFDKTLKDSAPNHATRFRSAVTYLSQFNADPQIVVTECSPGAGYDKADSAEFFINDLAWYDNEVMTGQYWEHIIGFCAYQLGGAENYYAILPKIGEYISTHPDPITPPPKILAEGLDISHWQGIIGWEWVANTKKFVFIKATEGGVYTDPNFKLNWTDSKDVNLLRGAYHYYRFAYSPQLQADRFIRTMAGDWGELPPVVDVEDTSYPANINDLKTFLDLIEIAAKRKPIIYTGAWFWNFTRFNGAVSWAKNYDLWVASYTQAPTLPDDWSTWKFWQYTNKGIVEGISTRVDLDKFNGTEAELQTYAINRPAESKDGETVPSSIKIVDSNLDIWTLGQTLNPAGYPVLKNGAQYYGGFADLILYYSHTVYVKNTYNQWWTPTSTGWMRSNDPRPIKSLVGLHLRADGLDSNNFQFNYELNVIKTAKIQAVKFTSNSDFNSLGRLLYAGIDPKNIVLRLYMNGNDPNLKNPDTFFNLMNSWLYYFNNMKCLHVEVHNEPNLAVEGLGFAWNLPTDFANWYNRVKYLIKSTYPNLLVGFPGLSPQPNVPDWLIGCDAVIRSSDWVGAHAYWLYENQLEDITQGGYWKNYLKFNLPIIITEFSNVNLLETKANKGIQYVNYYNSLTSPVIMAFSFVSSASNPTFKSEVWRDELGNLNEIPLKVGSR